MDPSIRTTGPDSAHPREGRSHPPLPEPPARPRRRSGRRDGGRPVRRRHRPLRRGGHGRRRQLRRHPARRAARCRRLRRHLHQPPAVRHRQRARRAGAHQRLVVVAAVQARLDCAYGEPLHAHPIVVRHLSPTGSASPTPPPPTITGTATGVGEYHYPLRQDFTVGVAGLERARRSRSTAGRDWTVTPVLERRRPHA